MSFELLTKLDPYWPAQLQGLASASEEEIMCMFEDI